MITISYEEKSIIVKEYPNADIVRTVKQKSKRHHYYMAEERGPMELLRRLRGDSAKPLRGEI